MRRVGRLTVAGTVAGVLGAVFGYALVGFGLGGGCGYFNGGPKPDQEWLCEGWPLDLAFVLAIGLPIALAVAAGLRKSWYLIGACLIAPIPVYAVGAALLN